MHTARVAVHTLYIRDLNVSTSVLVHPPIHPSMLVESAALAIGLSPLEKGLNNGLKGLSSMPRPFWALFGVRVKGLAKG